MSEKSTVKLCTGDAIYLDMVASGCLKLHELEVTKTDDPLNLDLCLSEDLEVSENFAKLQDNADNLLWLRHKCHQIAPTIEALLQDRLTKQGR